MKKNMGIWDRIIRVLIATVIIVSSLLGYVTGVVATILGIVAILFLVTSFFGFCPFYLILKISTKRKQKLETQ